MAQIVVTLAMCFVRDARDHIIYMALANGINRAFAFRDALL